jgi:hypothetical protein
VSSVSLLSSHHDPHGAPLRDVQRLHDPRYLIHKTDRSSYVVQNFNIPYLESERIWERITNVCYKMAYSDRKVMQHEYEICCSETEDGESWHNVK